VRLPDHLDKHGFDTDETVKGMNFNIQNIVNTLFFFSFLVGPLKKYDLRIVRLGYLPKAIKIRRPSSHSTQNSSEIYTLLTFGEVLCGAEYRQPGLLCTPQNFAQSSEFLGKKYILLLSLPLRNF
jgi:hypothetical protein